MEKPEGSKTWGVKSGGRSGRALWLQMDLGNSNTEDKPGKQEHAPGLCAPGHMPTLPGMSSLLCQDSVECFFQETSWNDSFLSFLRLVGQRGTKQLRRRAKGRQGPGLLCYLHFPG